MRNLITGILIASVAVLLYGILQIAHQNDQQAAKLQQQADRIESLEKDLARTQALYEASKTGDGGAASAAAATAAEKAREIAAEQSALDAARAHLAQIRSANVTDADVARANRDMRIAKDELDGVNLQLQENHSVQTDLRNQRKNGLVTGGNTRAMTEVEINNAVAQYQQNIKDLKQKIADMGQPSNGDLKVQLKSMQDEVKSDIDAISALRLGKQNYGAQWNAEKAAFEVDADTKLQQLKSDDDALKIKQLSADANFRLQQKNYNDLKSGRDNRAQAIRAAEQEVSDHEKRLAELQGQ